MATRVPRRRGRRLGGPRRATSPSSPCDDHRTTCSPSPCCAPLADAVAGLHGVARAAVVCSEGRSFCAGADFRSGDAPDPTEQGGFEARTGAFYKQAVRIFDSPVPLVAAVQGAAIGAGFGLALACDLCVVGELGWFQANFVRLGIHPGFALSIDTAPRRRARAGRRSCCSRDDGWSRPRRAGSASPSGWSRAGDEVTVALELATLIAGGRAPGGGIDESDPSPRPRRRGPPGHAPRVGRTGGPGGHGGRRRGRERHARGPGSAFRGTLTPVRGRRR